jgi:hypothetical protein
MKPEPISEAQVDRISKSYGRRHDFARAIIAARDAQWADLINTWTFECVAQPVAQPVSEALATCLDFMGLEPRRSVTQPVDLSRLEPFVHGLGIAILRELQKAQQPAEAKPVARCCEHDSDCAVHNMPAYPAGPCDCSAKTTAWVSVKTGGVSAAVLYFDIDEPIRPLGVIGDATTRAAMAKEQPNGN